MSLLSLDISGCIDAEYGISQSQLRSARPEIEGWRSSFLADVKRGQNRFFDLPMRQYQAYQDTRQRSPLGRVFKIGTQLHDQIDAVVIVGSAAASAVAKAVFLACCDPYHNEQTRAVRGSRPRIYFAGDHFDNDDLAALIQRLDQKDFRDCPAERRWALLAIDPLDASAKFAYQVLRRKQNDNRGGHADPHRFAIIQSGSWLDHATTDIPAAQRFLLPSTDCDVKLDSQRSAGGGTGGGLDFQDTLSFGSLLPAAMLGLDCIKLLEGAVMINDHFKTADPQVNAVLQFVGVHRLLGQHRHLEKRRLRVASSALRWLPDWYQSLGDNALGVDDPSPKHVDTHVQVDRTHHDPVAGDVDLGDGHDGDLVARMHRATRDRMTDSQAGGHPTLLLRLPAIDTRVLGQVLQMFMLTTTIDFSICQRNPPLTYVRH